MLGFQKNPIKFLLKSDCFVLSSIREGFGIVLIEALACNLPIIATKCLGPREILDNGDYGILVAKRNVKQIAEKMSQIYFDKSFRNSLRLKSGERVKNFEFKKTIKQYSNTLRPKYIN